MVHSWQHSIMEFWDLLSKGKDAVRSEPPPQRFGFDEYPHGGFMNDVHGFDKEFFGVISEEVKTMNLSQNKRVNINVSWNLNVFSFWHVNPT